MKNLILFLSISILFSSCAKDGETGPTGPQGPQGNANVQSFSFTVSPGQWSSDGTAGVDYEKYIDLPVPSITQSILTYGAVLVYLTDGANPSFNGQLPISYPGNPSINFFPSASLATATIELMLGNFQVPNITGNYSFKVVVIDGNQRIAHPEINWNDAKSISKGLNIE